MDGDKGERERRPAAAKGETAQTLGGREPGDQASWGATMQGWQVGYTVSLGALPH